MGEECIGFVLAPIVGDFNVEEGLEILEENTACFAEFVDAKHLDHEVIVFVFVFVFVFVETPEIKETETFADFFGFSNRGCTRSCIGVGFDSIRFHILVVCMYRSFVSRYFSVGKISILLYHCKFVWVVWLID
jgi:hypothetical protein